MLVAGACCAAEAPAAAPAATKPAAARYTQAPGTGTLTFSFEQAGAESKGSFRQFATELTLNPANPTAGSLKVTVQVGSLDTQDKDRDEALRGADLFDTQSHPTAQYLATGFAKRADGGLEAVGKLTLRGVTRDLRLPLSIKPTANGVELSGDLTLKRLDFGVGQGEWKSTEWVGDEVKLHYVVSLVRA
jgi:polyisoprenoid-binding protein YceI